MPKKTTARRRRTVCIPEAQAKKLGLSRKSRKSIKQVMRTDQGRSYAKARKAFAKEARSASDTTCSLVTSAANKLQSRANTVASVFKDSGDISAKQARSIEKVGTAARKRAQVICGAIAKRERSQTKRGERISALKGRR